jgi:hypothetical protein
MLLPFLLAPLIFFAMIIGLIAGTFAIVGGPSPCEPGGGPIVVSEANADSFQQKWDAFDAALDAGSPSSVSFSESEVTSRAIRAAEGDVDDQDWLQDLRVCLHDGEGEISGTVNLPSFLDLKFKARGTAFIGETLNVNVHEVEVGSVPGFIDGWVRAMVDDTVEVLDEDDFEHNYTLTLSEGEARVDGTP